jgi:hypothetical protein
VAADGASHDIGNASWLAVHVETERSLTHCLRAFEDDEFGLQEVMAAATGTSPDDVALALRSDGTLRGAEMAQKVPHRIDGHWRGTNQPGRWLAHGVGECHYPRRRRFLPPPSVGRR